MSKFSLFSRLRMLVATIVLSSIPFVDAAPVEIGLKDSSYFNDSRTELQRLAEFKQDGDDLSIKLANDFELTFDTAKISLSIKSPAGVVLAENEQGKIFGLEYIPEGVGPQIKASSAGLRFKFKRALALGESVTLQFEATSTDEKVSYVEWTFVPVRYTINGKTFDGVADQYYIRDPNHFLHKIWVNWMGPSGKDYNGAKSFRHSCYSIGTAYAEAEFGTDKPQQTLGDWGMFIDGGQMFQLIGLPENRGSIVEFMDEPVACRAGVKSNAYNNAVEVYYAVYIGRVSPEYTTPLRIRLLTAEPLSHNLWMEMTRYMKVKFQREYSVEPTDPAPMVVERNLWRTSTTFVDYFKERMPLYKEYGFRRAEIGWVWERGRTLSSWEPNPPLREWNGTQLIKKAHSQTDINGSFTKNCGGIESLADAVKIAHELGIEIFVWHQTAHGWRGSPDVRDHLEWLAYNLDGSLQGWGDDFVPTIWFSLRSGWKDATLKRLAELKKATNIDGLWLDVYGAGATYNARDPVGTFTMKDRRDYMSKMRALGFKLYSEGVSLECVDSYVIYDKDIELYRKYPFILYGASPYRTGKKIIEYGAMDLFKMMCYQSFPHDRGNIWPQGKILGTAEAIPNADAYAAEVKYRNRCFNETVDCLGSVIGVLETAAGTQWICEKGNALFFWDSATAKITSESTRRMVKVITPEGQLASPVTKAKRKQWEVTVPAKSVVLLENISTN